MSENENNEELRQYTAEELVDTASTFVRTQVTENYKKNKKEKNWEIIRDECDSGGVLDERCNIVSASLNGGSLDVVAKRLSCGCLMVAVDEIDELGWDIAKDPE